jgi:putative DNA primase/helicase
VDFDGILEDLKTQHRFVIWRYKRVRDKKGAYKWTKPPYQARNPTELAAVNDSSTWASFDDARTAYERGGCDGIGYMLIEDDDLFGVDFDGCVDLITGEISADALEVIDALDSYTTLSPSGTGVRILARGKLPPGGRRKGKREMYQDGRYLTLTGQSIGAERPIAARQAQIEDIHRRIFGDAPKQKQSAGASKSSATHSGMRLDDAQLLEKMFGNQKTGAASKRLWDGDTSAHDDDASAADLALLSHLLWWCNYDAARADYLFRLSGLMRPKWDQRHSSDGRTYGQMTLDKASEGKAPGDGYAPGPSITFKQSQDDEAGESPPDLLEFFRTDYGNAERLHALYGHVFRYCPALGYLVWDGTRWKPDEGAELTRMALETARALFAQAGNETDSERRAAWVKHSLACEKKGAIEAAVSLARSIPGVSVSVEELDADPMLLNVENGTIDLRTGKLKPHDPRDLITKLAPAIFDPTAVCPLWEQFQRTICANDSDLVAFKQRAYGYTTTGKTSEDALFIGYGNGANGKSTEQNIILQMLGDYANTAQFETFAVKKNESVRNDIADLMGARFVSASEGESRQRLAEGLVKQMTGGDVLKARFLNKEFFRFKPTFKLWLATNHKPVIRGTDGGIWRRIRLIPYAVTIPPEKRDKRLREKLEGELSGILNWALKGCADWLEHGLPNAKAVNEATDSYRQESDVLGSFLNEKCIADELHRVLAKDLYQAYKKFCEGNGDDSFSSTMFGRLLNERGFAAEKRGGKVYRLGISLQEETGDQDS